MVVFQKVVDPAASGLLSPIDGNESTIGGVFWALEDVDWCSVKEVLFNGVGSTKVEGNRGGGRERHALFLEFEILCSP